MLSYLEVQESEQALSGSAAKSVGPDGTLRLRLTAGTLRARVSQGRLVVSTFGGRFLRSETTPSVAGFGLQESRSPQARCRLEQFLGSGVGLMGAP